MTTELCEYGLVFGTCCAYTKDFVSYDTEKLHKATLKVIYNKEEIHTCKECLAHIDYDDYRADTLVYDLKTGKDLTTTTNWMGN